MTPEEFVAMLRLVVVDGATDGTLRVLREPPGRAPSPVLTRRSEWFNSLSHDDQNMVAEVVRSAAFSATFGFCSVLDGVRAFDNEGGSLRLTYAGPDGGEVWLNNPEVTELHAELRGDGPPL
jgi:hypothetical protein